ncbi:hypothetical protein HNR46_002595 [Haloferula luteola]|uniref:Uncharacterized protein n=1 Tax=Haloferula luteola TaxID=595692 RepID=A0A840VES6_9BACT|nr:hypothetical protein [Haloferula luteola]MBB5352350.1 hypothetical protein [Haloferula luteola]
MRPLPTNPESLADSHPRTSRQTLELGSAVAVPNHRRSGSDSGSAYPWLLLLSTTLAGIFCYLYLTKPVLLTEGSTPAESSPAATTPALETPSESSQRTESMAPSQLATAPNDPFEETLLRMQHVVIATAPDPQAMGDDLELGRLTVEVPIHYESGTIRWTDTDVAEARQLFARISAYQGKARDLREEAVSLISDWDQLMIRSIPEAALRADSPTLPENQGNGTADQADFKSSETIELHER